MKEYRNFVLIDNDISIITATYANCSSIVSYKKFNKEHPKTKISNNNIDSLKILNKHMAQILKWKTSDEALSVYYLLIPPKLCKIIKDKTYKNWLNPQDKKFYYTDKCSFYDELVSNMNSSETVYQWRRVYVRENKSNLCPTLTANMGEGGHNVPLIRMYNGEIRKLTPRECFNLQGFPKDYQLPTELCNSALYKQAGNSVVVTVIHRIAERIAKAL